jgi:hypothetical protein
MGVLYGSLSVTEERFVGLTAGRRTVQDDRGR